MKTEQFKRCVEKLIQEYERSKGKHPDFDSVDRAWRAIQREFSEVVNESLRDTIKSEALAEEMLHLSNVALQGYMFLTEDNKDDYLGEYALRDDLLKKENKTMNKEWWNGVIEACQAMRDVFPSCQYRARPEPKMRPLAPQEWLEALIAGKTIGKEQLYFKIAANIGKLEICVSEEYFTCDEMLNEWKFSDGSPCGVEVVE